MSKITCSKNSSNNMSSKLGPISCRREMRYHIHCHFYIQRDHVENEKRVGI